MNASRVSKQSSFSVHILIHRMRIAACETNTTVQKDLYI